MFTTAATRKIAFAALAAPVLAALALGLSGTASAEAEAEASEAQSAHHQSISDTITDLKSGGHPIVINRIGSAPLRDCTLIAIRQERHEHHGAQSDEFNRVFVDALCTNVSADSAH